jgi:hypothetical protein
MNSIEIVNEILENNDKNTFSLYESLGIKIMKSLFRVYIYFYPLFRKYLVFCVQIID